MYSIQCTRVIRMVWCYSKSPVLSVSSCFLLWFINIRQSRTLRSQNNLDVWNASNLCNILSSTQMHILQSPCALTAHSETLPSCSALALVYLCESNKEKHGPVPQIYSWHLNTSIWMHWPREKIWLTYVKVSPYSMWKWHVLWLILWTSTWVTHSLQSASSCFIGKQGYFLMVYVLKIKGRWN